jgi:hypothetical protein
MPSLGKLSVEVTVCDGEGSYGNGYSKQFDVLTISHPDVLEQHSVVLDVSQ